MPITMTMTMDQRRSVKPRFVPNGYGASCTARACVWRKTGASPDYVVEREIDDLLQWTERLLRFQINCPLHVVVYHSNEVACSSLERSVPATQLLAPVLSPELSLIACHSVEAHIANGDHRRMRRHLAHEVAHVAAALRTGSRKILGDGNVAMRLRSWVNEGFAECVASIIADRPDVVERALALPKDPTLGSKELDEAFDQLTSEQRATASAIATSNVWCAIARRGVHDVFAHLDEASYWRV